MFIVLLCFNNLPQWYLTVFTTGKGTRLGFLYLRSCILASYDEGDIILLSVYCRFFGRSNLYFTGKTTHNAVRSFLSAYVVRCLVYYEVIIIISFPTSSSLLIYVTS